MSRSEVVILRDPADNLSSLEEARSILSQMGIVYREEILPTLPTMGALRGLIETISQSVCIVAAGRSAYLLPILAASVASQQPLIVLPSPSETVSQEYLDTIFDTLRGYPVAFTRPHDAQSAVLLAVHLLASRHPSYADILQAFLQKRHLQPA